MLVAEGIIPDPADRPKRYQFHWKYGNIGGIVLSDDKSTARSLIKKNLGLQKNKRLPKEVEIARVENADQLTSSKTCIGSQDGRSKDSQPSGDTVTACNGS